MKETKKTIVSIRGEDLPIQTEKSLIDTFLPKLEDMFVDGYTVPDLDDYVPDERNVLIQLPSVPLKTPGGLTKPESVVKAEQEDYMRFPALIVAVGNLVKGYNVGDYVYLDKHAKEGSTRLVINNTLVVSLSSTLIVGKTGKPEKIVEIFKRISERNIANATKLEDQRKPLPHSNN